MEANSIDTVAGVVIGWALGTIAIQLVLEVRHKRKMRKLRQREWNLIIQRINSKEG